MTTAHDHDAEERQRSGEGEIPVATQPPGVVIDEYWDEMFAIGCDPTMRVCCR